jgi:hypothetical protein
MMNCEDYREALAADPERQDSTGHADSCVSCQDFCSEMLQLNENIAAAMSIQVPELKMPELPDLDMASVVSLAPRRSISNPAWFAMAATVLLAAVVGIRMVGSGTNYGSLEQQVLAHVDHEPAALLPSATPVSDTKLSRALPENIATMDRGAGLITYAQSCTINGKEVPHLVIQGEHGPITILLMPHEKVSAASTLDGVGVQGVIIPVGDGSIAIIGDREEQLEHLKKNILDSVTWST